MKLIPGDLVRLRSDWQHLGALVVEAILSPYQVRCIWWNGQAYRSDVFLVANLVRATCHDRRPARYGPHP